MKVLKTIGIVILALIAIPLIVAIFVPKSYTVSVAETINVPKQQVYDYVRILDNQKEYSLWVLEDPKLRPVITGTDGTCLLYTSDAADERSSVDLGGRRIIKKKKDKQK